MVTSSKIVHLKVSNIFVSTFASLCLIGIFWVFYIGLERAGYPFLTISIDKFFDLGFYSFQTLGLVIFLTMTPLQSSVEKLSPGFYSRMIRNPWSHFGLYVLLVSSIVCFIAISIYQKRVFTDTTYNSHLFMAIVSAIIFAILFHRFWVLRHIYHPYSVYTFIEKLATEESVKELWIELLECTQKAIQDKRISDASNFIKILSMLYKKSKDDERPLLNEDIYDLYSAAENSRPITRNIEINWPLLRIKKNKPEVHYEK